ncbi:MAG: hypothetical protein ACJ704_01780, partial [Nitrososphaeraceae archaeon]
WMELIFYRDRKHKDEVAAKMRNDERMGSLWQRSIELVSHNSINIMTNYFYYHRLFPSGSRKS